MLAIVCGISSLLPSRPSLSSDILSLIRQPITCSNRDEEEEEDGWREEEGEGIGTLVGRIEAV